MGLPVTIGSVVNATGYQTELAPDDAVVGRDVVPVEEPPATDAPLKPVAVREADRAGRRVKPIGSGHSWSDIAVPDDVLVDLSVAAPVDARG